MKKIVLNLIGVAVLVSGCGFVHKPLVNPEANVPGSATPEHVKQVVHESLIHYGWVIEDEKPGSTTAHLQQEALYAHVEVVYDQRHAQVRYLDSKNMYHSKSGDKEYIHSRYLVWSKNIAERINDRLNPYVSPTSGAASKK